MSFDRILSSQWETTEDDEEEDEVGKVRMVNEVVTGNSEAGQTENQKKEVMFKKIFFLIYRIETEDGTGFVLTLWQSSVYYVGLLTSSSCLEWRRSSRQGWGQFSLWAENFPLSLGQHLKTTKQIFNYWSYYNLSFRNACHLQISFYLRIVFFSILLVIFVIVCDARVNYLPSRPSIALSSSLSSQSSVSF